MRLIPKDEGFFELFDKLADCVVESSKLLCSLFQNPDRITHFAEAIKEVEHRADKLTHTIMERIDSTFVTPLDREDIHALATNLDNVVDLMDGTARRAVVFRIESPPDHIKKLAELLQQSSTHIQAAVRGVKDPHVVRASMEEVKRIEEEGDKVFAEGLGVLFAGTHDALYVIKWKELLDNLEHALDEAEDVVNVLESVSLKNS